MGAGYLCSMMSASLDEVLLVYARDRAIGSCEKMEAHRRALLHRAFSVFIFNAEGRLLLQRRSPL